MIQISPELRQAIGDAVIWWGATWKGEVVFLEGEETESLGSGLAVQVHINQGPRYYDELVYDEAGDLRLGRLQRGPPARIYVPSDLAPEKVDLLFKRVDALYPGKELGTTYQLCGRWQAFRRAFREGLLDRARSRAAEAKSLQVQLATAWRQEAEARALAEKHDRPIPDAERDVEIELISRLGTPTVVDGSELVVTTGRMTMRDINDEDHEHRIGPFRVVLDLAGLAVHIEKLPDTRTFDTYIHPHIARDGHVCWGNVGTRIGSLLANGQIGQACVLVLEFLQSYNNPGAYHPMEDDEDGASRWENCYENAAPRDCVHCDDSDCPYYDDAMDRCRDSGDGDQCCRCSIGECSHRDSARNECRAENRETPWNCVNCDTTGCGHHLDEGECADGASAEICSECPELGCEHRHAAELEPKCDGCPYFVHCEKKEEKVDESTTGDDA